MVGSGFFKPLPSIIEKHQIQNLNSTSSKGNLRVMRQTTLQKYIKMYNQYGSLY